MNKEYETILLAGIGMSPAILTETVWSLAHQKGPILPDKIVVVTTAPGRKAMEESLFDNSEWNNMVAELNRKGIRTEGMLKFGEAQDHIRLLPAASGVNNIEDITTPEESVASADFIMQTLREFTENPETRVIASIAGGRKTMSALMMSCMSLLGREQDRVCHVLVNAPYDRPDMDPPFYFPQKGVKHKCSGKTYNSLNAQLQLIDIPFVRMRGWYEQKYRDIPASYSTLVRRFSGITPRPINYPNVTVDMRNGEFKMDEKTVPLSPLEFALVATLAAMRKEGLVAGNWADVGERIEMLRERRNVDSDCVWFHDFCEKAFDLEDDTRKTASRVRNKLDRVLGKPELTRALVPSLRGQQFDPYPPAKIQYRDL